MMKMMILSVILVACAEPSVTVVPAAANESQTAEPVVTAPTVDQDLEPSLCYAGRLDYRTVCQHAGQPWKFAFDERCVSETAKPGQPSTGLLGGVPFLSTGLDPNWPGNLYRLDCRAEPAPDGTMLLCCP